MSINLLPWREAKHNQYIFYTIYGYAITACFIFLISVFIQWFFEGKTEAICRNNGLLKSEINAIPLNHLKQNSMLLAKLKMIDADRIFTLRKNTATGNNLLEIANELPASMIFQSLHMHDNKITINGVGNNINDIHAYVTTLQQKIAQGTITLSDVHSNAQTPSQFNFTVRVTI